MWGRGFAMAQWTATWECAVQSSLPSKPPFVRQFYTDLAKKWFPEIRFPVCLGYFGSPTAESCLQGVCWEINRNPFRGAPHFEAVPAFPRVYPPPAGTRATTWPARRWWSSHTRRGRDTKGEIPSLVNLAVCFVQRSPGCRGVLLLFQGSKWNCGR